MERTRVHQGVRKLVVPPKVAKALRDAGYWDNNRFAEGEPITTGGCNEE